MAVIPIKKFYRRLTSAERKKIITERYEVRPMLVRVNGEQVNPIGEVRDPIAFLRQMQVPPGYEAHVYGDS